MKKNYFFTLLATLCFAFFSNGQEMLVNGDFESWDNTTTPTGWDKSESITQESTEVRGGNFSALRNGGSSTKDLSQNITGIIGGDSYTISIWYKADGDGNDARIWSFWRTGTSNLQDENTAELRGPNNQYLDNNGNQWSQYTVTLNAPAAADAFFFEVRSYSNSTVYWDDFSFVHNATSEPSINIASPSNNTELDPSTTEVPVSVNINNFVLSQDDGSGNSDSSGDGYIKATLDQTGQSAEMESFFTTNFPAIQVTPGSEYTLTMELVDNSGNSLSPAVSSTVSFSVATYSQVSSLADLRGGTEGNYYDLSGEVILTYDAGNSRNQKYIQDATGAILIDDSDGVFTTSYSVGDGITGIKGKLDSYGGVLQLIPVQDPGNASSTGNAISSQVVTIADLTANFEDYESEWVTINDVTFTAADGSAVFASGQNYDITDGTNTLVFRTAFSNADLIGEIIPSSSANITGPAAEFNGTPQVFGTSLSNIVLGVKNVNIEGFALYPNPVNDGKFVITSNNTDKKQVAIFNILGKNVFNTTISGTNSEVNVTSMSSGVYILKVVEGTKTATSKLIIK
mgnify:CR=1 FL=1